MGWHGMENFFCDGMGWDGMGWDRTRFLMGRIFPPIPSHPIRSPGTDKCLFWKNVFIIDALTRCIKYFPQFGLNIYIYICDEM